MCGFAGFVNRDSISDPVPILKSMSELINHRGPDNNTIFTDYDNQIFMSFNRLSILDLSEAGNQPMTSASKRFTLCFNGEIYNHLELRKEISKLSLTNWRSSSDSETFVEAIDALGFDEALSRCKGMFAVAAFDHHKKRLHLARDRFGEKPLYYGWAGKSFVFGSDISIFKKYPRFNSLISKKAINYFLNYSYVPAPLCIYQNVKKVDAGQIVSLDLNRVHKDDLAIRKYWDTEKEVLSAKKNQITDFSEACYEIENQLIKTLKGQMISDVPLGAFLSGGIDSSLIVSLMKSIQTNVKTFTVGFENSLYDESKFAESVASYLETDHTTIIVSEKETLDVIPKLSSMYTEPFADSSQIPTFLVSQIAKENVTVALSGDGGDELFGGYNRYTWGDTGWSKISWIPFELRKLIGNLISYTPSSFIDLGQSFLNNKNDGNQRYLLAQKIKNLSERLGYINNTETLYQSLSTEWNDLSNLINKDYFEKESNFQDIKYLEAIDSKENMMLWDICTYLKEDILTKVDRAAMFNSLETRAPFLDHDLAKLSWRLPIDMKINGLNGKLILKEILYKYVPKSMVERPKSGFGIPIGDWIKGPINGWVSEKISNKAITNFGILNPKEVERLFTDHFEGKKNHTVKLWNIIMLQDWLIHNN